MKTHLVSLSLIIYLNQCVSRKYNNYRLFRAIPGNASQMEFFKNLGDKFDVNYWRHPEVMNMPVDFVISPEEELAFLLEAEGHGIHLNTVIEDLQKAFDKQTVKSYVRSRMTSFNWHNYYRLNDIYKWLRDLKHAFPSVMGLEVIGKTHENRDIMAVKILHNRFKTRSKVIVEGGIHAREWITPAFVTYMISQILYAEQSQNQALKDIATAYEWYFVPVLNPDGYEYTHTQDRMWRKNRNNGYGIDLNRNFGSFFGTVGISFDENSQVFCGMKAFSERESQAMAAFVNSKSQDLEYYLGFHSYGQYIIVPYAYSKSHFDNYDEVKQMSQQAAYYIAAKYGTKYTIGTAYDTVGYVASGTSACWVKKTFHVPYVVTFELRDSGYDGFALPPDKIIPTCIETMDGLISFLTPRDNKFIKPNYPMHNGQKEIIIKLILVCSGIFIIVGLY